MNGAHLHLILNHVSLFAVAIGAVVLAVSMKRKSPELRVLATVLFVIAGIFGWITVESGEQAGDIITALDTSTAPFVKEHALAATFAEYSGILVAILAIVMEFANRQKKWLRTSQWALLIVAIHCTTVYARTAYLGGLIRHTEIRGK